MAEWSIAPVLKTGVPQGTVSSNLTPSAMENRDYFERIVGGSEEERAKVKKDLQELFNAPNQKLAEFQLEKTPEDLETISRIESLVDEMVTKYKGNPIKVPLGNIYILKPGDAIKASEGEFESGFHQPWAGNVVVEKNSNLLFASTLAHEFFHFKSPKAVLIDETEDLHLYRSGLTSRDRKDPSRKTGEEKEYFGVLEEAIVAECVKKFRDKAEQDGLFKEDIEAVKTLTNWVTEFYRQKNAPEQHLQILTEELKYIEAPQEKVQTIRNKYEKESDRQAYAAGLFEALHQEGEVIFWERYEERRRLYELIDKIIRNSDGDFGRREELFDQFAQANFSGNYLPLAKIIEGALGKGSFRKIAEEFSK